MSVDCVKRFLLPGLSGSGVNEFGSAYCQQAGQATAGA